MQVEDLAATVKELDARSASAAAAATSAASLRQRITALQVAGHLCSAPHQPMNPVVGPEDDTTSPLDLSLRRSLNRAK